MCGYRLCNVPAYQVQCKPYARSIHRRGLYLLVPIDNYVFECTRWKGVPPGCIYFTLHAQLYVFKYDIGRAHV